MNKDEAGGFWNRVAERKERICCHLTDDMTIIMENGLNWSVKLECYGYQR